MTAPRPNVLMILADQHHAGLMGCAGFSGVQTPHLDALAAAGVRFTNAYCQNPICTPSRVSILSGQYCQNHGYYGLSGPAPTGLPNLFRQFKAAGYRTAAYGKLHLPESPRNWIADDVDEFGDSYESADGERGKSEFLDGLAKLGLRDQEDSWRNLSRHYVSELTSDARPSDLPYEHTMERWAARKAMDFATEDKSRPFCIQIALQKPHHPLLPQAEFWDRYPSDIELPATIDREPVGRPPHFQEMWKRFREMEWDYAQPGDTFHDGARRAWRGTLACITQMDDVVGRLLASLREQGLAENTIVIYGSDHGAYHGIHGIQEKAPGICSDAVCRVPMIWHVPGVTQPGTVCDGLVENIDMAPTLAALCGIADFDTTDGVDLTPQLKGERATGKAVAVTENPWSKAIRWDRWRYVHYPEAMFGGKHCDELYDLAADPEETRNLAADPAHQTVVLEGRGKLLDWMATTRRLVNTQPGVKLSGEMMGKSTYPIGTDGTAPNWGQPKHRDMKQKNYL
jgi:arylsulfatase